MHYAPEGPKDSVLGRHPAVKAVVTNGSTGFSDAQMAQLPELAMVCCFGAGYEGVDLKAAQRRDIEVTHAPGANDATVADHALALALGLAAAAVQVARGAHFASHALWTAWVAWALNVVLYALIRRLKPPP